MMPTETETPRRSWVRITPEIHASIVVAREQNPTASYEELGRIVGQKKETVRYVLTRLPRDRRLMNGSEVAETSLKARVMACLIAVPEGFPTAVDLRTALGMADDTHNVVHVLHSLRKQGRITFDTRGGEKREPKNIRWKQPKSSSGVSEAAAEGLLDLVKDEPSDFSMSTRDIAREKPTDIVNAGIPFSEGGAPVPSAEPEPTPVQSSYPELDRITARAAEIDKAEAEAQAYIKAAEALTDIDPYEADRLLTKAGDHVGNGLSKVEREYLAFAKDKETS